MHHLRFRGILARHRTEYRLHPPDRLAAADLVAELERQGLSLHPEADAVVCVDATSLSPPRPAPLRSVALAAPAQDDDLRGLALGRWVEHGARIIVPTHHDARIVREERLVDRDAVSVATFPLALRDIPEEMDLPADADLPAIAPYPNTAVLLPALRALRRTGHSRPVAIVGLPGAARLAGPGGLLALYDLLPGEDLTVLPAVADVTQVPCAALVLSDARITDGRLLRRLLATAHPVVAPATPAIRDHLAALGASAYLWDPHQGAHALAEALDAALAHGRGAGLGSAARAAVLREDWSALGRQVARALSRRDGPRRAPRSARHPAALRLTVLTPWEAGVSGALFIGEVLRHLAWAEPAVDAQVVTTAAPAHLAPERAAAEEGWPAEVLEVPKEDVQAALEDLAPHTDVVWCSWARHLAPPAISRPLVATIHDLNWRHFDSMSPAQIAEAEEVTPAWTDVAAAVVCSSEAIRSEIRSAYGVEPGRVHVVPLTVLPRPTDAVPDGELREFARSRSLPGRFLLYPAVRSPHKNHVLLVRAAELLRAKGHPVSLVFTGSHTDAWYHGPDVIGLGYVSDRDLDALYRLSCGVVLPSLYEAGSFPMWEAMRALRPVACSGIPAHLEQLRRTQAEAVVFDPTSLSGAADAMDALFTGSHGIDDATLGRNAEGVCRRDWREVAADYREILAAVAARPRPEAG